MRMLVGRTIVDTRRADVAFRMTRKEAVKFIGVLAHELAHRDGDVHVFYLRDDEKKADMMQRLRTKPFDRGGEGWLDTGA